MGVPPLLFAPTVVTLTPPRCFPRRGRLLLRFKPIRMRAGDVDVVACIEEEALVLLLLLVVVVVVAVVASVGAGEVDPRFLRRLGDADADADTDTADVAEATGTGRTN